MNRLRLTRNVKCGHRPIVSAMAVKNGLLYKVRWFILVILMLATTQSLAAYDENGYHRNSNTLQANLNNIISRFRGFHVGVSIQSLSTGRVVYQYHANDSFVPASTLNCLQVLLHWII